MPTPPIKQKEKPLKLTKAQEADINIAILRGLGTRSVEEISRKVGYSPQGVRHREKGPNEMLMIEIAQIIKHELNTQRHLVAEATAANLREKLGERAPKLLGNIDQGLEAGDVMDRAKFAKGIVKDLVLGPQRAPGGRKQGDGGEPPTVYNVSIKSMQVVHSHVKGEAITVPDRQKAIDAAQPTKVALPVKDAETVRR
jgi:hypothetical protein